jgi:hypothetical protein
MQTIIQTVLAEDPAWLAGCLLLGMMVLYAVLLCYGALRRLYFERGQRALAREHLFLEIKAAKLRCQEAEQVKMVWNGWRKFEVAKKIVECEGVASLYLAPHDKHPLPPFKPGQFLTFQLNIPGETKPVVRCYSLSDAHRPDCYRVTIKKVLPQPDVAESKPGLVSSHFYDRVKQGDILDVKAPSGHFFLDLSNEKPVVLISGGVGVTPMVSMLNAVLASKSNRHVWFFFGVRNRAEHIFKEYLEQVAAQNANLHLHICYSRPDPADVSGRDYHHARRVSVDLFKELLPSSNYEYFLCGPDVFMESIAGGLIEWGVPKESVHREAFNAVAKVKPPPLNTSDTVMLSKLKVTFGRSGQTVRWNPTAASLLDFAEQHGVKIDSGCRVGNCGTCLVAIKNGAVEYQAETTASAENGSCLTCICKPKTDLVIDA